MKIVSFFACAVWMISCQKENTRTLDTSYNPDLSPAKFTNSLKLTHKFLNYETGKTYYYEGLTADGKEREETTRLASSKQ